jgi:hypothetical protein
MKDRLATLAAVSAMTLALALSPCARAQQETRRATGGAQNPTAGQREQAFAQTETIRGVVAGVTAEGEAMFDYRTNRAVAAQGTFLTVVGSPTMATGSETTRNANEERGSIHRRRHNVYYVWLTPKTKVCDASDQPVKAGETRTADQKREVALDKLEVGDHVEIQFALSQDSGSTNSIHQSEQMRRRHGRDRTHVGYASEITILPEKDHDKATSSPSR